MSDLLSALIVLAGVVLAIGIGLLTRRLTRPRTAYYARSRRHHADRWDSRL